MGGQRSLVHRARTFFRGLSVKVRAPFGVTSDRNDLSSTVMHCTAAPVTQTKDVNLRGARRFTLQVVGSTAYVRHCAKFPLVER